MRPIYADDLKALLKKDLRSVYSLFRYGNGIELLEMLGETVLSQRLKKYNWKNDIRDKEFIIELLENIGIHKKPVICFNGGIDRICYNFESGKEFSSRGHITIANETWNEFILNLHKCDVSSSRITITGKSVTEEEIKVYYEIHVPADYSLGDNVEYIILRTNHKDLIFYIILSCEKYIEPKSTFDFETLEEFFTFYEKNQFQALSCLKDDAFLRWLQYNNYFLTEREHIPKESEQKAAHNEKNHMEFGNALMYSHENFKIIKENIYNIKLNPSIASENFILWLFFRNYAAVEPVNYAGSRENLYFLPEVPEKVLAIQGNHIYNLENWQCEKVVEAINITDKNAGIVNIGGKEGQLERFLLFNLASDLLLDFNGIHFIDDILVERIIDKKCLFEERKYIEILKGIQKKAAEAKVLRAENIFKLNDEILKLDFNSHTLQSAVDSGYDLRKILVWISKYSNTKEHMDLNTFLSIIRRAEKEEYYHVIFGLIYEEFINKHAMVPEYGFRFMDHFYRTYNLNTDFSMEALKTINLYFSHNMNTSELFIRNCLINNEFDSNFFSAFKIYYDKHGPMDKLVVDSVYKLIHYKFCFSASIIDIFSRVYEFHKNNIPLLEEIVWLSMIKGKYVRRSHLQTLVNHFVKNNIFSERSRWILAKAFNKGLRGYENFLVEIFKYEIFKTDQNIKQNRLYYFNATIGEWEYICIEKERSYALPVGYSTFFRYSFSQFSDDCVTIETRYFIEDNNQILLSLYDYVKDEEFRNFVIESCLSKNEQSKKILLNHSFTGNVRAVSAIKLLLKKRSPENIREAAEFLIKYFDLLFDKGKIDEINNLLAELAEVDVKAALELISRVISKKKDYRLLGIIKLLLQKAVDKQQFESMDCLLNYIIEHSEEENWRDYAVYYVRGVSSITKAARILIGELYKKYYGTDTGEVIEKELIQKENSEELGLLLYDFYSINHIEEFKIKAAYSCLETPEVNDSSLIRATLEVIRDNKIKLKEFIKICSNKREIAELIYKLAEDYFERDVEFYRELLESIAANFQEAQRVLNCIRDMDVLAGHYFVTREIDRDEYGAAFEASGIFNDKILEAIYLEDDISKCFDSYLSLKKIYNIKKDNSFYLMEFDGFLNSHKKDISLKEIFNYVLDIIDFEEILIRNGYCIICLYPENIGIIGSIPVPERPYSVHEFNGCVRLFEDVKYPIQKQLIRRENKASFMELNEEDIAEIICNFTEELISSSVKNSEMNMDIMLRKILREDKPKTIRELRYKIIDIINGIEYGNENKFNLKKSIINFNILDEPHQRETVNYLVKEDIYTKQAYNIVLNNNSFIDNINMKFKYLITYIQSDFSPVDEFVNALLLSKLLLQEGDKITSYDKELKNCILNFLKNCVRYKVLQENEMEELLNKLGILNGEDKNGIRYFINSCRRNDIK